MISAAVVAAAIGFVPTAAQAAEQPAQRQGSAAAAMDAAKAAAAKSVVFHSPAERTVRTSATASASGKAAASQAAGAAEAAKGNAGLAVDLRASATSAHGFSLASQITTAAGAPVRVDIDWGDGRTVTEHVTGAKLLTSEHTFAEVGDHKVTVTLTDQDNNVTATNSVDVQAAGSKFTPHAPTRLLDTRSGIGGSSRPLAPYGVARVKVGGNSGIPADATAVALNVTVVSPRSAGHITAYPSGTAQPTTSNVNFVAGQTVPNMTIVPVGADGYVELVNRSYGDVDLLADVTGYFSRSATAGGYTSLEPFRIADSRTGQGTWGQLAGQSTFGLQVAGNGSIPASGVTAVALNVTATAPRGAGHLTVYPSGQTAPDTSNVNFKANQTIANSVIVPVGPDGRINIRNGAWDPTDVVVDVVGYYSPGSKAAYLPTTPTRLHDSRKYDFPVAGQDFRWLPLADGDPTVTAFVLNTTVTDTRGSGHLTVAPDPYTWAQRENGTAKKPTPPNSSNLNWTKGETVPNLVQASTGATGVIDFWNRGWEPTHLVVDMFGLYEKD
ncbi:PKD domain-containing protein [Streptomyces sp. PCS3-D2]|uniref:PKD domain-containing protein n=1 Tax=Streptomyces sp. PCS3-D2 TaxID=1460244 RepID=UPI00044D9CD0|nr:PKD domain-containing protein [Streptomyces sp. PCS3-D2]WKV73517.1 PKD domain-containing protein [Streptomyces sp. PCS3-D2]